MSTRAFAPRPRTNKIRPRAFAVRTPNAFAHFPGGDEWLPHRGVPALWPTPACDDTRVHFWRNKATTAGSVRSAHL
jgi:hypothetical protein